MALFPLRLSDDAPVRPSFSSCPRSLKAKMAGNDRLPDGKVTFVVGTGRARQRIEHITKAILCVRSDYFSNMFRSGT